MSEEVRSPAEDAFDDQRIARAVAIGLPTLTLATAVTLGVTQGLATSILALAAGLLLGVIALLWNSMRILSGDAVLSPELESLDMAAQGVDALAGRKKMLLRALKDLETEHSLGKMEEEDFLQISSTYRAELKTLLKRIDDSLAPHREKAEAAARAHLEKVGLGERPHGPPDSEDAESQASASESGSTASTDTARVECPRCGESNEPDARFCKGCAKNLVENEAATSDD